MATRKLGTRTPTPALLNYATLGCVRTFPRTGFVGSPGFFAPELLQRPAYDGARADLFSLGAVMVELIFGHDFFGAVWYPAYESFLQVDSFAAALAEALVRVRCGPADRPPAAPPVQALLNGLLEVVP